MAGNGLWQRSEVHSALLKFLFNFVLHRSLERWFPLFLPAPLVTQHQGLREGSPLLLPPPSSLQMFRVGSAENVPSLLCVSGTPQEDRGIKGPRKK